MSSLKSLQTVQDFKEVAYHSLDTMTRDYINGGSGNEVTLHANSASFDSYFLKSHIFSLRNPPDYSTTILGTPLAAPICISPTAFHKLAHTSGELATSVAAKESGTIYTISCLATTSLTQLNALHDMSHVWVQLLMFKDRGMMRDIIKQAEEFGCSALVITVDAPVSGNRKKDTNNQFTLPADIRMELLREHKLFDQTACNEGSMLDSFFETYIDPFFSWDDIKALVQSTHLPVVLKGILRAEDALKAYEHGVKGIIISNHGGRQLDGALPTIVALEHMARMVHYPLEIYIDGGIRCGTDIFKALALGARAIFLGRPVLWGLAVNGQAGVQQVLSILKKELLHTMYLCGASKISDINSQFIWRNT